jgi:hypothetical protein
VTLFCGRIGIFGVVKMANLWIFWGISDFGGIRVENAEF